MIRTEAQLQDLIHSLYEGDISTPSESEVDYLVRRNYLNMGIGFWESFKGVEWNELYTTLADDYTGADTTVAGGDTQSDCPDSLVRTLGFIQLTDSNGSVLTYRQVAQSEAQIYINSTSGDKVYWITGTPGSYKINWHPTISSELDGATISYPFYKRATLISAAANTPDMADSMFLVHYALHWLYKEEDPGRSKEQFDIANQLALAMKQRNDMEKVYQDRSMIDKLGSGFGI